MPNRDGTGPRRIGRRKHQKEVTRLKAQPGNHQNKISTGRIADNNAISGQTGLILKMVTGLVGLATAALPILQRINEQLTVSRREQLPDSDIHSSETIIVDPEPEEISFNRNLNDHVDQDNR